MKPSKIQPLPGEPAGVTVTAPAQPRHVGRNGGLVDEDKLGRIKQTLLALTVGVPMAWRHLW